MFDGGMLIDLEDHFDYGEGRWFGTGFGIAIVVWTERRKDVTQIISERGTNRHEQHIESDKTQHKAS